MRLLLLLLLLLLFGIKVFLLNIHILRKVDNVVVAYHFCSDQSQSRLSCFIFQPPEQSEQPIILPTLVSSCQREC